VDVGGPKKGFHCVALCNGSVRDKFQSHNAKKVAEWCRRIEAQAIAVDAPCRWSTSGRARPAERELMAEGIWCFSTPSREVAEKHPTGHFQWMLAGAELFRCLEATHHLFSGMPCPARLPVCFETFRHAVVCALAGKVVTARPKATKRRTALCNQGYDDTVLPNIDFVDAGLCALAALHLVATKIKKYGNAESGIIVVPRAAARATRPTTRDRPSP